MTPTHGGRPNMTAALNALHRLYISIATGHPYAAKGTYAHAEMTAAMEEARRVLLWHDHHTEGLPAAKSWQIKSSPSDGPPMPSKTRTIYGILRREQGQLVSYDTLIKSGELPSMAALRMHISTIRRVLRRERSPEVVLNFSGLGYVLGKREDIL